jgi:hypothetical protein
VCVTISALLHFFLLASDSPEYRTWVAIQIVLQLISVVLLYFARRFNPIALFLLILLSAPFTYINALYTNYGSASIQFVVVTLGWGFYGCLVYSVKDKFQERMRGASASAS